MRFINFQSRAGLIVLIPILVLIGCKKPKPTLIQSPPHYDFSKVGISKLDLKLKEISGLAWDADKDQFLAHYDEAGTLFYLNKQDKSIVTAYPFGPKGDYEDIALYNGIPYILRSDGMITKVIKESDGVVRGVEAGKLDISGTNDFETMYADTARKALIIVCKNCEQDSKAEISAFAFYPDSIGFVNQPVYRINAEKIKEIAKKDSLPKTSKFQPSAAGIHPITQQLFIISSASNQLLIADRDGNPESVFHLSKKLFPQPEGLTFNRKGEMYISNEGVTSRSTILWFQYYP